MPIKHFISLLFICLACYAEASNDTPSNITYIKNNGQWNSTVLYQADFRGGRLFLEKNAVTYLFYPQDGLTRLHPHNRADKTHRTTSKAEKDNIILNFHSVRMEFLESSSLAATTQLSNKPFYNNYYRGKDASKWVSKVPISEDVIYNDLYEGVSLKAFSSNNDFRYDFTVNPQTDASVIKMKFTGQDKLSILNGKLIISTSVGDIAQEAPYAYQVEEGKQHQVNCRYKLRENIVAIEITGDYNHNLPLIIDPTLVFATFTGSTADNWGMSASYDNQGNGYTSGICFGKGYPATLGAFQQTTNDTLNFDIVVSKFNSTGSNLLFSTYLGGSINEAPESIIVDNNNNLLVLGHSYSSDFPITTGAYDISQNGGSDIIVTKFNATGTALLGSTFIGGSGDDGVNYSDDEGTLGSLKYNYADNGRGDIILDNNNNIYIASCTESTDFPSTAGCLQNANKGMQDGCVFKLNTTLTSLTWSTYLGGSANDAAYNLAVDNNNSVYVTGGTESLDFPVSPGALNSSYGGNIDGFLIHISSGGNAILQSTYIGTSDYDQSYFVQLDKANNVYIYGQTSGNYPITTGVYSNANSGQFIHAFNPTLSSTLFSTEFGTGKGTPDIVPSAFLIDKCSNIYISGWGGALIGYNNSTSSTTGMPVTANAIQPGTDGMDFYFLVLQKNASALWYASFFGGDNGSQEHVDGGTSRFDKSGIIYQAICEGCAISRNSLGQYLPNSDMPTTPTAWSTTDKSPNCNNALVKYKFDLNQTSAVLSTNPTSTGCAPFTVNFTNQSINAVHYNWSFGDGNTATSTNTSHTFTIPGTYTITLVAIDSSTCNMVDTTYAVVTVNPSPVLSINSSTICAGNTATLSVNGASTYTWSTSATTPSIVQSPATTTQYTVTGMGIGVNTCTGSITSTITVNSLPNIIVPNSVLCIGNTATLTASGALSYTWNTSATGANIIQSPTVTTNYTVTGTDSNSCVNTATVNIKVNPLPVIHVPNGDTICAGHVTQLIANGATTYTWSTNTIGVSISPSPMINTNYTVTGTDLNGCVNTATISISVNPSPTLIINNATICVGNTATLTVSGASTYTWNTGITTPFIVQSPLTTSQYTVTGTNLGTNACTSSITGTITVNPLPKIIVPNSAICIGNTATLTASGATTYTWNTLAISAFIVQSPTVTTNYTVTGTDSNSCVNTATVSIKVNPLPIVKVNKDTICSGTSALLTANGAATYTWSTSETGSSISPYPTTTSNYTVTGTDLNGCVNTATTSIWVNPSPDISVTGSIICIGSSATLTASGASSYTWSTGQVETSIIATPTVTSYYTVSSTNGICVSSRIATVTVMVNHTRIAGTGTLSVCAGDSIKIKTLSTYASYTWNTGQNTPTIEAFHTGIYFVNTIDTNGCKGIDSVKVFEDSPVALPVHDTTICSGETAQLHVTQGYYIYLWSPALSLNKDNIYNPIAHPIINTTYTVSVTNGVCINTNTLTIYVNPSPKVTVKPNYSLVLAGESIILHASSTDSCSWYPTTWLSCVDCNTNIATPDNDITYTITAINNEGCSTSTTATVQIQVESTFYLPNTFTPNNDGRNDTFKPAYTNIYNYKMVIFDRWGLLLFQSTNPDEGWDGIYRNGACQQDVYVYKVEYMDNVTTDFHSLSGHVNLIR
jgi:gliding motility-associated-like protein